MALDWQGEQASQLEDIRRETLDIYNRLHSINQDAAFVQRVHDAFPDLPLLPNLRCGAWYTDPAIATAQPAYFKSTDGHFGNWGFTLRRPNLHLLPLILAHHGLVLVDSTRAGKRLPDALSKTVPIWCAVLNRAVLLRFNGPPPEGWDTQLYTPPGAVSAQEHAQITARLLEWAVGLAASTYDLPKLPRPLRPLWITPDASTFPAVGKDASFLPVFCVSASRVARTGAERRAGGFVYVQGSGDDHELWAQGLTPALFWTHRSALLVAHRADLPELVEQLVQSEQSTRARGDEWTKPPTPIQSVHGRILVCAIADLPDKLPAPLPTSLVLENENVAYIVISADGADEPNIPRDAQETEDDVGGSGDEAPRLPERLLHLCLPSGKRGQHAFLRDILPRCTPFARTQLASGSRVVFACGSGADASVGAALAVLTLCFSNTGTFVSAPGHLNKDVVRTRLQWIIASRPEANPSRTTLKRVNDFLLAPVAFQA